MHAFALLSLLQAMPAGPATAAVGDAAPAAAGEGGAQGAFAELLAGFLAMAGQAQPAAATPSIGGEKPAAGEPGPVDGFSAAGVGSAVAAGLEIASPAAQPTSVPGEAVLAAIPAAPQALAAPQAAPATPANLAPTGTPSATPTTAVATDSGAVTATPEQPEQPEQPTVPSPVVAPQRPGIGEKADAKTLKRATPATPSAHASAAALSTPSRTRTGSAAASSEASVAATADAPTTPTSTETPAAAAVPPVVGARSHKGLARAHEAVQAPADAAQPARPATPADDAALPAAARVKITARAAAATAPEGSVGQAVAPVSLAGAAVQAQILEQAPQLQAPGPQALAAPAAAEVGPAPAAAKAPVAAEEASAEPSSSLSATGGVQTAPRADGSGAESSGGHSSGEGSEPAAVSQTAPVAEGDVDADAIFDPIAVEVASRSDAPADVRSAAAARATSETVANLAAQMARRMEGRNTRFDIALDPAGLGSVQVSIEISARGELSAHLSFERGDAASELRARGAELQRALEQAGFDLSKGGLSFEHGPHGRGQEKSAEHRHQGHARAFAQALETADAADLVPAGPVRLSRASSGVDLTV